MYFSHQVHLSALPFCLATFAYRLRGLQCGSRGLQSFLKTWTARKLLMHAQCLIYTLSLLIFEILEFNLLSLRFLCYSESSALLSILFVLTAPSVIHLSGKWKSQNLSLCVVAQHFKSPIRPEFIFQGFLYSCSVL